jgi:hypothetical protein
LPLPTKPNPSTTKKSHARKQPRGHIPRPRNAFILFRCDYGRQKQRTTKECDQNDISRMVGDVWRNMSEVERAPWVMLADEEKKAHAAVYPDYKYTPRNRRKKARPATEEPEEIQVNAGETGPGETVVKVEKPEESLVTIYYPPWAIRRTVPYPARRAVSCPPPGAIQVEPYSKVVARPTPGVTEAMPKIPDTPPNSPVMGDDLLRRYGVVSEDSHSHKSTSGEIVQDPSLTEGLYTIDPPGGTSSWGSASSSLPLSSWEIPQYMTQEIYSLDPFNESSHWGFPPVSADPTYPTATSTWGMPAVTQSFAQELYSIASLGPFNWDSPAAIMELGSATTASLWEVQGPYSIGSLGEPSTPMTFLESTPEITSSWANIPQPLLTDQVDSVNVPTRTNNLDSTPPAPFECPDQESPTSSRGPFMRTRDLFI